MAELTESDSAYLDSQLLLAEVLGVDRTWLMTWSDKGVDADNQALFFELVRRRRDGEPIAYILGMREFWGREFFCNKHTLIPRPDTERLIEAVLDLNLPQDSQVLDLGTGTGCIGLTLAAEQKDWQVLAVDYSLPALKVAERNKEHFSLTNVELIQSDWYSNVPKDTLFDLVVANPPYIDPQSPYVAEGDVRFEPDMALTSDQQGLNALQHVIFGAPKHLRDRGWLAVEHGYDQALSVKRLLVEIGFTEIQQFQDIAGLDRCSIGQIR